MTYWTQKFVSLTYLLLWMCDAVLLKSVIQTAFHATIKRVVKGWNLIPLLLGSCIMVTLISILLVFPKSELILPMRNRVHQGTGQDVLTTTAQQAATGKHLYFELSLVLRDVASLTPVKVFFCPRDTKMVFTDKNAWLLILVWKNYIWTSVFKIITSM